MDYLELMRGAGLGDVLIPKKEFVKEHERLVKLLNQSDIPALRKEAKDQQAELKKEGGSGKSNFIARMMAEAKYKHRDPSEKDKPYDQTKTGKYRKPVMDPERDDTKMSQAVKFDYKKLASKNQSGTNKEAYGASPFITHHFGLVQSARKPKETAAQSAARRKFSGREARKAEKPEQEPEEEPEEDRFTSSSVYRRMMKYNPSLLLENKIKELVRPTKSLVKKGESPIRTPAEQREADRQLRDIVRELDERGYDPKRLGIKNFNPDKYRD